MTYKPLATRAIKSALQAVLSGGGLVERYNNDPAFHAFATKIVTWTVHNTLELVEAEQRSLPSSDNSERVEELEQRVTQLVASRDRAWAALYRKDHHIITLEDGDRYCAWCDNETCQEEHYGELVERMRPVVEAAQALVGSSRQRFEDKVSMDELHGLIGPEAAHLLSEVRAYESSDSTTGDSERTDEASDKRE